MAADTIFSITQIELALAQYFGYRANVIVPKVSWGLLNHEADLLIMNKTGYLTEVEIKRSWADFLADFGKRIPTMTQRYLGYIMPCRMLLQISV